VRIVRAYTEFSGTLLFLVQRCTILIMTSVELSRRREKIDMNVLTCCQSPRGSASVPSYLPRQPLKHQPVYLSVLPFHLRRAVVKEGSNTMNRRKKARNLSLARSRLEGNPELSTYSLHSLISLSCRSAVSGAISGQSSRGLLTIFLNDVLFLCPLRFQVIALEESPSPPRSHRSSRVK
jgi:hypothetical protein